MIVFAALMIVYAGTGLGLLIREVRRDAAARRHRCPPERPWPDRELRLRHALQGHGQWIDTEEVGLPPEVVHRVCASAGWRVQAAFRVDPWASMLWVVGPSPPPVTTEPRRPGSRRRRWAWFVLAAVAATAILTGFQLALDQGDSLPTAPTLAVGVVLGTAWVFLVTWADPMQRPRRVLWADLTAQFHGDRVRISVGSLPRRYEDLVRQLAESLGYRPTWGGSRGVRVYRPARTDGHAGMPVLPHHDG